MIRIFGLLGVPINRILNQILLEALFLGFFSYFVFCVVFCSTPLCEDDFLNFLFLLNHC